MWPFFHTDRHIYFKHQRLLPSIYGKKKSFWKLFQFNQDWKYLNFDPYNPEWRAFQVSIVVMNPPANARVTGSIPGLGRSPGLGNGNPLQYPCLENSRTEEAGGLQSMRSQRVGHDWAWAHTHTHTHTHTS